MSLGLGLPPEMILCRHSMHCMYCDKGYYSLVAGQKHEARCPEGRKIRKAIGK